VTGRGPAVTTMRQTHQLIFLAIGASSRATDRQYFHKAWSNDELRGGPSRFKRWQTSCRFMKFSSFSALIRSLEIASDISNSLMRRVRSIGYRRCLFSALESLPHDVSGLLATDIRSA